MSMVKGLVIGTEILTEASNASRDLHMQGVYGVLLKNGQLKLSFLEALYLESVDKLEIFKGSKKLSYEQLIAKAIKSEKNFLVRLAVYKDLRDRGYVVKTALKFGADFRVYEKGIKPGEDHAKWVVFPVKESEIYTWHDFSAKNRVAHSTKKRLMIGIVDDEHDVTYYEIKWTRP